MNREFLKRMSAEELDEYAATLGITAKGAATVEDKIALIEGKRERTVTIRALGADFEIPIRRAHDQRVAAALAASQSDADMEQAIELILGEEQMQLLIGVCTDTDGTVDAEAMGLAFVKIITSPELKNF